MSPLIRKARLPLAANLSPRLPSTPLLQLSIPRHSIFLNSPCRYPRNVSLTIPHPTMRPFSISTLPYWHFNVPLHERSPTCPDALKNLSDKDVVNISMWDAEYQPITWSEAKYYIDNKSIGHFRRLPSSLRKYRFHIHEVKQTIGSVQAHIIKNKLRWKTLNPVAGPFEDPRDLKILYNEYPYGFEPGITHLVVWTKFVLEEDPTTGLLTFEMWENLEDYVERTFEERFGKENVLWWKNTAVLKSVRALEHFHVLIRGANQAILKQIVDQDEMGVD